MRAPSSRGGGKIEHFEHCFHPVFSGCSSVAVEKVLYTFVYTNQCLAILAKVNQWFEECISFNTKKFSGFYIHMK
jgi:hypothetical protein